MEYVTLESYDGKMVRIHVEKKEEYLRNQEIIKSYLEQGKSIEEIKKIQK